MNSTVLSLFDTSDDLKGSGTATALGPNARDERAKAAEQGDSSDELLLGHLLWTSVSESVRFRPDVLASVLRDSGLDPDTLMPRAPRAASALSSAADAAQVKRRSLYSDRSGHPVEGELYVNVIFRTAARGVKQMVTETLDAGQNRLSYEPLAAVEVDEEGELRITRLSHEGPLLPIEIEVLKDLRRYFAYEKPRHDDDARRAMLKALRNVNSIPLRNSGGMYFVRRSKEDTTKSLLAFVAGVRKRAEIGPAGGKNESHAARVELIDSEDYRQWVALSLEDFIEKESDSLINEMTRILKTGAALTRKRQSTFMERVRALKRNVAEYEELLDFRATQARSNLELAGKEAKTLLDRIAEVEIAEAEIPSQPPDTARLAG